jgi:hypothetical protein
MLAENGATDYKGQKLCTQCWNGKHKHCEHGLCECCCAALAAERKNMPKKNRTKKLPVNWERRLLDWETIHGKRPQEPAETTA